MLAVVGISHQTSSLELLEQLVVKESALLQMLSDLAQIPAVRECILLNTCGRSELYADLEPLANAESFVVEQLFGFFCSQCGVSLDKVSDHLYCHTEDAAIKHLFSVSSGLDSIVLGENQILSQVRLAWQRAVMAKACHASLSRLFTWAIRVGKRVRTQTDISQGAASISQASVQEAQRLLGSLARQRALVIGCGTMGKLVVKHLLEYPPAQLDIANRTYETARQLASDTNASTKALPNRVEAIPLGQALRSLGHYDIVFCATGSPHYLITPALLPKPSQSSPTLLLVDISMPRNIDPRCISLQPYVQLFSLSHLQAKVAANLAHRAQALSAAQLIVSAEVAECLKDCVRRTASPVIQALRSRAQLILTETLSKTAFSKLSLDQQELLMRFGHDLLGKLLHAPTTALKELSASGLSVNEQRQALQQYGFLPADSQFPH